MKPEFCSLSLLKLVQQQPTGGDFPFPDGDLWGLRAFLLATELGILIENMLASWPSAPSQSTPSRAPFSCVVLWVTTAKAGGEVWSAPETPCPRASPRTRSREQRSLWNNDSVVRE